jgi:hypothetical protein
MILMSFGTRVGQFPPCFSGDSDRTCSAQTDSARWTRCRRQIRWAIQRFSARMHQWRQPWDCGGDMRVAPARGCSLSDAADPYDGCWPVGLDIRRARGPRLSRHM